MSSPSLARRLSTADAVTSGLGAMLGAGVFAAPGPAAAVAGHWRLAGLGPYWGFLAGWSFVVVAVYATVLATALGTVGPATLASASGPLAVTLPAVAVLGGSVLLAAGSLVWLARLQLSSSR